MLVLKDINKIYKSKKAPSTEALKNINITLGDKGLVFILGKSGSGKSTLLNILGGLDSATSGEIIVDNKSTKEFKSKDWDAYRNTYMGFIFQEYNLLDNYNIEENIKMSLELQGKKITHENIVESLNEVGLEDLSKRKPNELSGGQKQRIAISRALIKKPKIILADEPTGNLDSETSTQIFEILKKLSRDRLVIIVSHDEESANKYADRIIKISDGEITSDNGNKDENNDKELNLIYSKLPAIYSIKMGLSNLIKKKIKLIITFLIILVCLACVGVSTSCLQIDIEKQFLDVFKEKKEFSIDLKKYSEDIDWKKISLSYLKNQDEDEIPDPESFTKEDVDQITKNTKLDWTPKYNIKTEHVDLGMKYLRGYTDEDPMYYWTIYSISEIYLVNIDKYNTEDEKIIGTLPSNEDEIAITSVMAEAISKYGILAKESLKTNSTIEYYPKTIESIIEDNYYINIGDYKYLKVTAILDYRDITKEYSDLKEKSLNQLYDLYYTDRDEYNRLNKKQTKFNTEIYKYVENIYVTDKFINKELDKEVNTSTIATTLILNDKNCNIQKYGYLTKDIKVITKDNKSTDFTIKENEIVIDTYILNEITNNDYQTKLNAYLKSGNKDTDSFLKEYLSKNDIIGKEVLTSIKDNRIYNSQDNYETYKIVGITNNIDDNFITYYNYDQVKDIVKSNVELNSLTYKVKDEETLKNILKYYPLDKSSIISTNMYSYEILDTVIFSSVFKELAKYAIIIFCVLSILILTNFINTSIKFRKKEIGILRAMGCHSKDIIKIFIYETLTLTTICSIVSFILSNSLCKAMNQLLQEIIRIDFDLFVFDIKNILIILVATILITILSTIIPIIKISKQKPIDTILDR